MFDYAASYFRDPDAQYYLARLYLDGAAPRTIRAPAARWFVLAAQKGQCQAQAMLGAMLFAGDHVPRQAARGLMWLTLAKDSAKDSSVDNQAWINRLYDSALRRPTKTSARWPASISSAGWKRAGSDPASLRRAGCPFCSC